MVRGLALILCCYLLYPTLGFAYETGLAFKFVLRKGVVQGVLVSQDNKSVVVQDSSGMKLKLNRKDIVSAIPLSSIANKKNENKTSRTGSRTYLLEDLKRIPSLSISSGENLDSKDKNSKLYGGKSQDIWVSEVLSLAERSRRAEESHNRYYGECNSQAKPADSSGMSACSKAKAALAEIEKIRREYADLMSRARRASVPITWLETHYVWVRWGEQWQN